MPTPAAVAKTIASAPARLIATVIALRWSWVATPIVLVLASRIAVVTLGYVSLNWIPDNPHAQSMYRSEVHGARLYLGRWYHWDGAWYAAIALRGYHATGPEASAIAFWPLLPAMEWALSRPIMLLFPSLRPAPAILWAGLIVVFAAFMLGAVLLYGLLREDHGPEVARRAVAFLAFAPGALFYTAAYPESLLLAAVVGCLWALRRQRWMLAGGAGFLAALSHVPGCLLALPFAWEYLRRRKGRLGLSALWVLLIPLGPALYLLYALTLTGDLLAPSTAAGAYWNHRFAWPWETLLSGVTIAFGRSSLDVIDLLNLVVTVAALAAGLWALRAGHTGWALWSLGLLILYLSLPAYKPLDGMLRYTLPVLPLWLLLARAARTPALEGGVIGLLAGLLGLLTALFVNGWWVA